LLVSIDTMPKKSPRAEASDFIRDEIHHVRTGKHGARSVKQIIAIGLSKARRAGVVLAPPKGASKRVRRQAESDSAFARSDRKVSPARSRASKKALAHESKATASHTALSRHAHAAARARRS
jgi:hypothetical protein